MFFFCWRLSQKHGSADPDPDQMSRIRNIGSPGSITITVTGVTKWHWTIESSSIVVDNYLTKF
jgi:hypothetical protein